MIKEIPAVSVIVPLFNAEAYIGECLTSLAGQTLQDFEIIVVDDCSTDGSRAVVENFFAHFGDNLKLMMISPNSGCAAIPRNFAMAEARGKYVYFLDADDLLTENALAELYEVAESSNADVVHPEKCITFFFEGGQICAESVSFQEGEFVMRPTLETFDFGERMAGFVNKRYMWWACNKLFRRQFLRDNRIAFPALKKFEDFIFVIKCLLSARNYVRVPFVSYCYRLREDSLSHQSQDAVSFSQDAIKLFRVLDEFIRGEQFFRDNPQYRYRLLDFFMQEQLKTIADAFFGKGNSEPAAVFECFNERFFSANPEDNAALTAYLFVAANVLKNRLEVRDNP